MARSARRTLLTRLASPLWGRPGPRGLRGRLLTRYLRGNPRRWTSYLLAGAVWRIARRIADGPPEPLYRATLGTGRQVSMATSDRLPRRLRTRAVRKALESAYRAETR